MRPSKFVSYFPSPVPYKRAGNPQRAHSLYFPSFWRRERHRLRRRQGDPCLLQTHRESVPSSSFQTSYRKPPRFRSDSWFFRIMCVLHLMSRTFASAESCCRVGVHFDHWIIGAFLCHLRCTINQNFDEGRSICLFYSISRIVHDFLNRL